MNLKRLHKEKKPKEKEKVDKQFAKKRNRWQNELLNTSKLTSKLKVISKKPDKK